MTVGLPMLLVEARGERVEARPGDRPVGERHGQLIGLTPVAQIGGAQQRTPLGRDAGRGEHLARGVFHAGQQLAAPGRIERDQIGVEGPRVVAPEIGRDEAECGKRARRRRHDDLGDLQFVREGGGVHRAGAAESDQRELARVVAALERDDAQCLGHIAVDDLDDRGGRVGQADSERVADPLADRRLRRGRHRSAAHRRATPRDRASRARHRRR